ncbi:hypothetical protein Clacol_004410 [Clathrus columnatus]|uniref:Uncharacterized protein n=1 Tax=Clathrus columnatus TaxID=1419009 RepID=A0AAV5A6D4_9AGAM|nr:hypothetical protein Clacol_004410 [Clathrus columnatus]
MSPLSALLTCKFTRDLRRRNTTRSLPNQSSLEFPDLNLSSKENPVRSTRSVLGRIHEGIIADMGERNDLIVGVDRSDQEERDGEAARSIRNYCRYQTLSLFRTNIYSDNLYSS